MTLHRTNVPVDQQIDLRDKTECRKNRAEYQLIDRPVLAKFSDGQISPSIPESLEPTEYVGVRSYIFDDAINQFTIYITFVSLNPTNGVYPTLNWRIQLGIGPENERSIEGSYTPTEKNESGLLVSFCSSRMFRTLDLAVNILMNGAASRKNMQFSLGGYGHLSVTCFPVAVTGENGTITWMAKDYRPTPIILP